MTIGSSLYPSIFCLENFLVRSIPNGLLLSNDMYEAYVWVDSSRVIIITTDFDYNTVWESDDPSIDIHFFLDMDGHKILPSSKNKFEKSVHRLLNIKAFG